MRISNDVLDIRSIVKTVKEEDKGINMNKKRILAVLLAAVLLFTMDAGSILAMEAQEDEAQQNEVQQDEVQQNKVQQDEAQSNEVKQDEAQQDEAQEDEVQQYTVSFDLNGGVTTEGESSFSLQVQEGTAVDADSVPMVEKKGYLFQGWRDEEENDYDFTQPVGSDMTLSASWTPISYRIQFDLNGGQGAKPPERQVRYDEDVTLPMRGIYKTDYVLTGWEQAGIGIYQDGTPVKNLASEDGAVVVLKAVWRRGEYKVRFDANGGSGKMEDEVFYCGQSKKLRKNTYTRKGYTFAGWNIRKDGTGKSYKQQESVSFSGQQDGSTVVLYAVWKGNSYTVQYNGNGAQSGTVSSTSHVYGIEGRLSENNFKRIGYQFAGWNTKKDGKGKKYAGGAVVRDLTATAGGIVILYAQWKPVSYNIMYYTKGGKLSRTAKKSYNITNKTFDLPIPTRKGYDFDGWYKDAKCKKRVSEIKNGSYGNKKYYAKWVKCTTKPNVKWGKLTVCRASATGKVSVKATLKKRVASSDDRYYLVYVHPYSGKPYKMAKKVYKKNKLSFTLKTSENQGYALARFGIAVKKKGKYSLISNISYVKHPEKAAKNKTKYKLGKTKKGMQFCNNMQEIDACGAKNNFLNLTVSYVFSNATVPYQYNGKTYYFNNMEHYQQIVSECNKKGINVTMQILLDWVGGQTDLIDANARIAGAAPYYSWNVTNNAAREKMEAVFCYIGNVFGKKKCYVSNWILGNEINNPGSWNYRGGMSTHAYFKAYAYAFRALSYAVRSQYSNARIFVCMDNFWNTAVPGGYSVRYALACFVEHLRAVQKEVKWNLAYHAYSTPLTYTNFWDGYGITYDADTPYVTMKNLNILTSYVRKKYGSSVRVILSEQGYSSNWGQANQAAAIAASYYIAACNPMVDAFIIRSYYDHPEEVAQGLPMGIAGKEAFEVYKYMDTSKSSQYTNRYLGLIGISSWKELVPGYRARRIYTMYR